MDRYIMAVINIPGICSPIITTDNEHATLVVSGGRKAKARREMSFRQYFTFLWQEIPCYILF